ncbi:MAG: DDE-type integrase/transposase/recombinase [Nanoarchaeota archaeon]|nr:DDE-type integrase/transposase/recombinase [Nanoarchaeota archaeon]
MTRPKLLETLRVLNDGASKYQARKVAGITKQRVYQVWKKYLETGEIPEIGRRNGRPPKPLEEWERDAVQKAFEKYRVCADGLERLIRRDFGVHIPHNHIHRALLELGYAKRKTGRAVRKKAWKRYERRHSLTAVHIDWHQCPNDGPWVFAVEDDASRKLLALRECLSATTDESIQGMKKALKHGKIKQCISDHGSQFVSNLDGDSRFQAFLAKNNIKPILCRVKHPQSNGKVEKWFDLYERHRDAFNSVEDFLHWYNEVRPHRSLNWEALETPTEAFERKKKAEV